MLTRWLIPRRLGCGGAAALALGLLPALPLLCATSAVAAPSDEVRTSEQWVLDMLDVQRAWYVSKGAGVTVAVIDSGVYPEASDLAGAVTSGPDFTRLNTKPSNPLWGQHGTWMASIIAGRGHDGFDGIVGVAPEAKILSIRVIPDMNDPGYRHYNAEPEEVIQDELAKGIMAAVRDHAKVISMSIGYSAPSGAVRKALQYAYQRGTVLVASSGNSGDNDTRHAKGFAPVSFPAEYPGVLSVGAVTVDRTPTQFSSGNLSVKVAAPGKDVPAEGRGDNYYVVAGTSPACALVAGVAALIESRYPKITPAQVTEALIGTARQTAAAQQAAPGDYNVLTGFGIVDAGAALSAAGKLVKQRPQASVEPLTGHFGGGAAAVPAPPVSPRGTATLVIFALLTLISFAAAYAGYRVIRRTNDGGHGGLPGGPPGLPSQESPEAGG